jgi:hypothetical protein
MAATKFTEAEREKLFAQLEAPFDPALIKWRVMRTFDNGRSGVILPFADPRAYTDRLNELFTPSGWTREYTISTVPSLCRMERGKAIVTSKVLIATAVTITRLGSHTGTGEEWADRENAVTAADAQAFKRACSCFGLGRYLYRFGETRVRLNGRGEPMAISCPPFRRVPSRIAGSGQRVPRMVRRPVLSAPRSDQEGYPIPRRSQKANLLLQLLTWFFSSLELWSASSIRRQFVPERQLLWRLGWQSHRHAIGLDGRCAL